MITANASVEAPYCRIQAAADMLGTCPQTVRNLIDRGELRAWRSSGNHRMVELSSIKQFLGDEPEQSERIVIGYARVSTTGSRQSSSLQNQKERLEEARKKMGVRGEDFLLLSESASGISWDRPKFNEILEKVIAGEISKILVTTKERLTRSGIKALSSLFAKFNCEIVALDQKPEETPEEELLSEITAALFAHGAKEYGRRSIEKFSYKLEEEHLELIERLQDEGWNGREIERECLRLDVRDTKSGKPIGYNWIIRHMRKRQKAKLILNQKSGIHRKDFLKFMGVYLVRDSEATVGSHLLKRKFEEWVSIKCLDVDTEVPMYWKSMLEQFGIPTFRDSKKQVSYIKGWKFKTSRK